MSFETSRAIVEARLIAQWPDVNVAFENMPYDPPDETVWARLSVQFVANEYNGLGECREITGLVGVQIYTPMRQGTNRQEQLADLAVQIFSGSHDGIAYRDANIVTAGEVEGWYQCNVTVAFTTKG